MAHRLWKRLQTPLLLLLLFAGGLATRMIGIGWGLPYVEHPDEPALVKTVVRMVQNNDPNPHTFLYPSFMYYMLALSARLHAWWGIQQGIYQSIKDLPPDTFGFTTAPGVYIWQRGVTALLGALTVPVTYLLGRDMYDRRVGLIGALLVMLATFHVFHSHLVTADAPTGLWVVLTCLAAWQIAVRGAGHGYLIGGLATGLAAGTKYNAVAVALAVAVAHVIYWRKRSFSRSLSWLIASGVVAALTFIATTPYAILDWDTFIAGLRFNTYHYGAGGHGDFTGRWELGEYSLYLWTDGLRPFGSVIALIGLPLLLWRSPRPTLILLVVIVAEMLLLMAQVVNFVRNVLPVFPLMLLVAAAGAVALADRLKRPSLQWVALTILVVALLGPQIRWTSWLLQYWSRPYTLVTAVGRLRELPRGMRAAAETSPTFWDNDPIIFPAQQDDHKTLDWYRANGYRYLLVNEDFYPTREERVLYNQMVESAPSVLRLPERKASIQVGPSGAILDLGQHPEMMPFARREMRFGDQIELLGYELIAGEPRSRITPLDGADTRELGSGQPMQINLYWKALADMDRDYTMFIHVVDQQGQTVTQRDLPLRYGDYQTSQWQPDELVIDRGDMGMPALPPGTYTLQIGLYDGASGEGLSTQDPAAGSDLPGALTTITIR